MEEKRWLTMKECGDAGFNSTWERVWKVEDDGTMTCLLNGYSIGGDQLIGLNWIEHMAMKTWCDLRLFLPAYAVALRNIGVSTIDVSDLYFEF